MQGTVKFFDNDRGFGFISREGGDDVFAHVSNLQVGVTTLAEGRTVEFDVTPGRKSEEAKTCAPPEPMDVWSRRVVSAAPVVLGK